MSRIIRCTQGLTLVAVLDERTTDGHKMGLFQCRCGNQTRVRLDQGLSGYTRSCGCLAKLNGVTHGMKGTPTYRSWRAMKGRCLNPTHKDYPRWGAKGVIVCERWQSFENFFADMGVRPEGTSIDRYPDRHGNYEPGNCRWATTAEQEHNKDGFVVIHTPLGVMPLIEYAPLLGITVGAAHMRLKRGKLEGCSKCALA